MKSQNRNVRSIPVVLLALLIAGCSSDSNEVTPPPPPPPPPQEGPPLTSGSVVVNRSSVLLTGTGQSRQLTARTMDGSGAAVNAAVVWSSSAPDQVSVDATGRVVARTIGSAQIFATSGGVRSAPVFVVVAEPQPGALLVNDAQVLAIGPPLGLAPGEVPGVGTRYEVRLTEIATPPTPGTVVLAAENATVAGKVVSTRNEPGATVVTLSMAPLGELFTRYNVNWSIDVSALPAAASQPLVGSGASNASHALAAHPPSMPPAASILRPISVLNCDASLGPVLFDRRVQLAPTIDLRLEVVDTPGHTRRALVGSIKLEGGVSFKLNFGFKVQGKCEVHVPIPIPIGGPLAVGVMPFVRFGVGVNFEGQLFVTAGEYSATGKLGVDLELGWECGGAQANCRSLESLTPIKDFDEKFEVINPESGMRVELQGQVYALAGLDAAFLQLFYAQILEARVGLVQSVDLGFETDQVLNPTYASKYDLKLEVVVEPGSGLQRVLDMILGGQGVVTFKAKVSTLLSQSPKGVLSVSRPVVGLSGQTVDIKVDLTNTDYFRIPYNVERVELWHRRVGRDTDFKWFWTFNVTASNQSVFTHTWLPTPEDLGTNEFAAIVFTAFPVPGLEVADNSIREVDVKCFTTPRVIAATVAAANTCADTWMGSATFDWPGELHIDAYVTWTRDPANPEIDGGVYYIATGQALVRHLGWENKGCSVSQGAYAIGPQVSSDYLFVDYRPEKPTFEGNGGIAGVSKLTCPDGPPIDYAFSWLWWQGAGQLTADGTVIEGTLKVGDATWQWKFTRP